MDIQKNSKRSPDCGLLPTRKQLERDIAHTFNAFNHEILGVRSSKMTCTIFNNYLTIVGESAMTPVEEFIYESGQLDMLLAIRESINGALEQKLEKITEELLQVKPLESFCKLSLNTRRLMGFVILSEPPSFRVKQSRKNRFA